MTYYGCQKKKYKNIEEKKISQSSIGKSTFSTWAKNPLFCQVVFWVYFLGVKKELTVPANSVQNPLEQQKYAFFGGKVYICTIIQ